VSCQNVSKKEETMQSHDDRDFRREWYKSLGEKADRMHAEGKSRITGGNKGEKPLAEWQFKTVHVRHMPEDEHGILRISIGGGDDTPIQLNYCVFRGSRGHCIDLLRKALKAMEAGPGHHDGGESEEKG
jgi:hypothetical protein